MFLFQESICLIRKLMSYLAALGLMGYTIQFRIVCRTVCVVSSYVLLPANTPMMMAPVIAEIGLVSHKTCLVVLSTHTHTHLPHLSVGVPAGAQTIKTTFTIVYGFCFVFQVQ